VCGFCHAPEHAYEALLEHPEIDGGELCAEAQERLRMAAAPEPPELDDIEYAWSEQTHQWIAWRTWGACATCGARTWRYSTETSQHECARCQTQYVERCMQMQFFYRGIVPPDWEIERDWLANHPRQVVTRALRLAPLQRLPRAQHTHVRSPPGPTLPTTAPAHPVRPRRRPHEHPQPPQAPALQERGHPGALSHAAQDAPRPPLPRRGSARPH
jgi:hypothetical protein